MFNGIGWAETFVLLVAALVILGPERLPGAISWTVGALRQVRDYASGATNQLRQDLGPEIDELRKPLTELQRLRAMTPQSLITEHLLDGDDSLFTESLQAPTAASSPPIPVSTGMPDSVGNFGSADLWKKPPSDEHSPSDEGPSLRKEPRSNQNSPQVADRADPDPSIDVDAT